MDAVTRDIEQAVSSRLSSFGAAGTVVVLHESIELRAGGLPAAIETPGLAEAWPQLTPEQRMQTAHDLARRLASAAESAKRGGARSAPIPWIPLTLGGVVVLAVIGVFVGVSRRSTAEASASASASVAVEAASANDRDRAARSSRACEASRKKVYAGAALTPHEGDGWVVELWLARADEARLSDKAELRALLNGTRVAATADAELAKIEGGEAVLEEASPTKVALGKGWSAARLRFSGRYADAYLDPSGRARFLALADRAAHAAGAGLGALYGRCDNLETHELGAWFYGADARAASVALLYSMGMFSELPAVPRSYGDAAEGAIGRLMRATEGVDAAKVGAAIGPAGGAVSTSDGASLIFPLGGPIRATAASRDLARSLHLEVQAIDGGAP